MDYDLTVNICVLGEVGVGRKAIILRYTKDEFVLDTFSDSYRYIGKCQLLPVTT